ncbi:hypothetical protein B9Z55_000945 [Caenorhabditis nigoni]|nr:hypothetical protein B9Z55_000945 [Caenorhabditis nigoni]
MASEKPILFRRDSLKRMRDTRVTRPTVQDININPPGAKSLRRQVKISDDVRFMPTWKKFNGEPSSSESKKHRRLWRTRDTNSLKSPIPSQYDLPINNQRVRSQKELGSQRST